MSYLDRITFNPQQCGGRPCIRGMRIRVKDVLDLLAAGLSEQEILRGYPDLEPEDIRACLQYAAAQASAKVAAFCLRRAAAWIHQTGSNYRKRGSCTSGMMGAATPRRTGLEAYSTAPPFDDAASPRPCVLNR